MGSCSSVPVHETSGPGSSPQPTATKDLETIQTASTEASPVAVASKSHNLAEAKQHSHGSETEEYEESHSEDQTSIVYELRIKDENSSKKPSKLNTRYSSGGSSFGSAVGDDSEDSRTSSSTCSHLLQLKRSLSREGDLCAGVVRIEVSSS